MQNKMSIHAATNEPTSTWRRNVAEKQSTGAKTASGLTETVIMRNETRNVRVNVILRGVRAITDAVEKQWVLRILSVCPQPLSSSNTTRMRQSVACPALLYFSTLSHKRHDFRVKRSLNIKRVLTFSTALSETFLTVRRTEREMIKMYIGPT
jgi:hypothetical protein